MGDWHRIIECFLLLILEEVGDEESESASADGHDDMVAMDDFNGSQAPLHQSG